MNFRQRIWVQNSWVCAMGFDKADATRSILVGVLILMSWSDLGLAQGNKIDREVVNSDKSTTKSTSKSLVKKEINNPTPPSPSPLPTPKSPPQRGLGEKPSQVLPSDPRCPLSTVHCPLSTVN